jgi:hypothetical protein
MTHEFLVFLWQVAGTKALGKKTEKERRSVP